MTEPAPLFAVDAPQHPERNVTHYLELAYSADSRWALAYHRGSFYEWHRSRWRPLDKETLESSVYAAFKHATFPNADGQLQSFSCSPGNMEGILRGLRNETLIDRDVNVPAWLNGNVEVEPRVDPPLPAREVLACGNTLLHTATRRVFAHTPRLFNVNAVDYDYDPNASTPTGWLDFLSEIWPDDPESIGALQEWFGYCLTSRTDLQKMLMIVGPKRSGKGTIVRVLTALMGGAQAATSVSLADLNQRFGLEHLENRQLGIMQDARFRSRDDGVAVERLLSITGEDEVSIDKKGKGLYAAKLPTRFILVSNELPVMQDESGALQSRFVIVKTLDTVDENRRNSRLGDVFVPEYPGILNWALDGLDRLNLRGHFVQPKSAAEDAETMTRLSSTITAFAEEYLAAGSEERVARDSLYVVYEAWCRSAGLRPKSREVLGRDLRSKFPRVRSSQPRENGKRRWYYTGVGLNESGQEILQQRSWVDNL